MPVVNKRSTLLEEAALLMRDFMTYAVLYQDLVAKRAGVTSSDLQALGVLVAQGPTSPGELAHRTGMTAGGAITALIDRLERAGYVNRHRDERDRRRVVVTANLEQVGSRLGPLYAEVGQRWSSYLDTLTEPELRLVNQFLSTAADINKDLLRSHAPDA